MVAPAGLSSGVLVHAVFFSTCGIVAVRLEVLLQVRVIA
jgi:hypothetical protein